MPSAARLAARWGAWLLAAVATLALASPAVAGDPSHVKYGQCWVFSSAVTNADGKTLGTLTVKSDDKGQSARAQMAFADGKTEDFKAVRIENGTYGLVSPEGSRVLVQTRIEKETPQIDARVEIGKDTARVTRTIALKRTK